MICRHCGSWDRANWRTECLWPRGEDGPCVREARHLAVEQADARDLALMIFVTMLGMGLGGAIIGRTIY